MKIFETIEDVFTIIKGEIELAKNNLAYSAKKLGIGLGFLITSFLLINVSLLFLLISLAFGFVDLGLSIKPQIGKAILFYNVDDNENIIPKSKHRANNVLSGEKWICTIWSHIKPYKKN